MYELDPIQAAHARNEERKEALKPGTVEQQAYDKAVFPQQMQQLSYEQVYGQQHNVALVDTFIKDVKQFNHVPKGIQETHWSILDPSSSATFMTEKDKPEFDLHLSTLRLIHNMSMPASDVKPEELRQMDNIRIQGYNNFKRCVGGKDSNLNFLKLVFTNIQQVISSSFQGNLTKPWSPPGLDKIRRTIFG